MFSSISERYETKLDEVPSVGDSLRDLQAAFLAGCTPILVLSGKGKQTLENGGLPPNTVIFDNLAAVADHLLTREVKTVEARDKTSQETS